MSDYQKMRAAILRAATAAGMTYDAKSDPVRPCGYEVTRLEVRHVTRGQYTIGVAESDDHANAYSVEICDCADEPISFLDGVATLAECEAWLVRELRSALPSFPDSRDVEDDAEGVQ